MDEREVALTIIRGAAAGAGITAQVSQDPKVSGVATGVQGLLALVGKLVEMHGTAKAEGVLKELVDNPATALSEAELDEDVARLRRELGL